MTLAQACALFIQYFSGDLSRTKELVHIVEELTTGLKPKARWAERECREAKRFAQTLPKIAQSSV
jgi:gamma-glutamyl:cysteine ligase YbdK (ATP-grasp superfamily)